MSPKIYRLLYRGRYVQLAGMLRDDSERIVTADFRYTDREHATLFDDYTRQELMDFFTLADVSELTAENATA
jgi:hypothetical protein